MTSPVLLHLPDPIGWISLAPDRLRDAQLLARSSLEGLPHMADEAASRAQGAELVDVAEMARRLSVDASWLLKRARERRLPFYQLGKYVRFDPDEVIAQCRKSLAVV